MTYEDIDGMMVEEKNVEVGLAIGVELGIDDAIMLDIRSPVLLVVLITEVEVGSPVLLVELITAVDVGPPGMLVVLIGANVIDKPGSNMAAQTMSHFHRGKIRRNEVKSILKRCHEEVTLLPYLGEFLS
jgi:hypothetical protein